MNFANVKTLAIPEGNVKQIEDAQGNVLWKKAVAPFKITSITDPAVGSHSITGNTTATLTRTDRYNEDTFTVYFNNFDTSKSRVKISGSITFGQVMSAAYALSSVTFNGNYTVTQNTYNGQTLTFECYKSQSSTSGSFTVKIKNGISLTGSSTTVTVNLTITPA